jgi:hypothetical protein
MCHKVIQIDSRKLGERKRAYIYSRLCSSLLLRLENLCCPDLSGFPEFVPRHIYEYAYATKSLQPGVSLRFSAPRYGFYCTTWSIEIARRMIKCVGDEKMCDGVHIMAIGKEELVPDIMAAAGLIKGGRDAPVTEGQ